jgi:hypothetical protein
MPSIGIPAAEQAAICRLEDADYEANCGSARQARADSFFAYKEVEGGVTFGFNGPFLRLSATKNCGVCTGSERASKASFEEGASVFLGLVFS